MFSERVKGLFNQVKEKAQKGKETIAKLIEDITSPAEFQAEDVILPWERDDLEEVVKNNLKTEALNLSRVHSFFLKPPEGMPADFQVRMDESYSFIAKLLNVDPNLNPMRYFLVPEFITEDLFWRNYFARLYLLIIQAEKRNRDLKKKKRQLLHPPPLKNEKSDAAGKNEESKTFSPVIAAPTASKPYSLPSSSATISSYQSNEEETDFGEKISSLSQQSPLESSSSSPHNSENTSSSTDSYSETMGDHESNSADRSIEDELAAELAALDIITTGENDATASDEEKHEDKISSSSSTFAPSSSSSNSPMNTLEQSSQSSSSETHDATSETAAQHTEAAEETLSGTEDVDVDELEQQMMAALGLSE
ncbi:uncharacterized protein MONOS_12103 [Monocercomonoides exilis]|uniref:uncharacterized protein n=1 Tax=Monocercomonoides exilis TaxID=2049356 RepID=UPI0035597172|nr:hypothetical protein MONOS_12103 [Monocercomonoides exilis]|eukprot:MONOS_12103.1-p1 / transcript=MONOS_12103.1 / gene=MONOS_12103 / organism=Monocercomonoides_exilis_PA203 / gene_product=unspecified product / transcript_product=unspecified product / location=Mono_scaffold00646:1294-2502(+) / protein_length=364 / sequence_SO=supercontig / SO=protein_coding / is_pseudo=false